MGKRAFLLVLLLASLSTACDQALTAEEAREALDEISVSSQALSLSSSSEELVVETDFTIGEAVESAAEKIRDFVVSQLPCAEITLQNATLSVQYGATEDPCTYNGHTFSGEHEIRVERNQKSEVLVHHQWTDLSNGEITVSGFADVTWSLDDPSRHVVHELDWVRLVDGRTGTGSGDRVQRALGGGIREGISVDGSRAWEGERGRWDLDIDEIEMRWVDPVPQAGKLELVTPFDDKSASLTFKRADESTIGVTFETGNRSFEFKVRKVGPATLITKGD
jgi:hypothetical protein